MSASRFRVLLLGRGLSSVSQASAKETATAGAASERTKIMIAGIGGLTVLGTSLGTALIVMSGAERIANKTGQTAKEIAMLSKAGSAEEAELLKKTEKMAHAAALGSANGASDALKTRWWPSLSLPSLSLPSLSMPSFSLPSFSLPSFSLPSFMCGGDSKKDPVKKE